MYKKHIRSFSLLFFLFSTFYFILFLNSSWLRFPIRRLLCGRTGGSLKHQRKIRKTCRDMLKAWEKCLQVKFYFLLIYIFLFVSGMYNFCYLNRLLSEYLSFIFFLPKKYRFYLLSLMTLGLGQK